MFKAIGGALGGGVGVFIGHQLDQRPQEVLPERSPEVRRETPEEIKARVDAQIEQDRIREAETRERTQTDNQRQIVTACREGNLDQVPGWLRRLDDNHFLALSQQTPEGSEETLNRMCEMLIAEQNRRFPNNTEG